MDLALNNLQRSICHKTQQTNQPTNQPEYSNNYYIKDGGKVDRLKISYNDVISASNDFFNWLNPSTAKPMKEKRGTHGRNLF